MYAAPYTRASSAQHIPDPRVLRRCVGVLTRNGVWTRCRSLMMSDDFQHILRIVNTNVDGKQKIPYAMTAIRGVGRRFAILACKKAEVDVNKRAGELSAADLESLMVVISNPRQFKIPDWFLNRQKDIKDGRYSQVRSAATRFPHARRRRSAREAHSRDVQVVGRCCAARARLRPPRKDGVSDGGRRGLHVRAHHSCMGTLATVHRSSPPSWTPSCVRTSSA
jgi:ribosomal protein S13